MKPGATKEPEENHDPFPTLEKLIARGGLLTDCATRFRDNRAMALEFLADCAEQCFYTNISDLWGEELSLEIVQFADLERNNEAN